jgi:hypothetical protein
LGWALEGAFFSPFVETHMVSYIEEYQKNAKVHTRDGWIQAFDLKGIAILKPYSCWLGLKIMIMQIMWNTLLSILIEVASWDVRGLTDPYRKSISKD